MNDTLHYRNYSGSVEYSGEDGCFFGEVLGIKDMISYEGETIQDLEQDFREAVEDYIQTCERIGKQPEQAVETAIVG